ECLARLVADATTLAAARRAPAPRLRHSVHPLAPLEVLGEPAPSMSLLAPLRLVRRRRKLHERRGRRRLGRLPTEECREQAHLRARDLLARLAQVLAEQ